MNTFLTPATILIQGPSQSGKSTFIEKLIKHRNVLFKDKFDRILIFYGIYDPKYEALKNEGAELFENLPDSLQSFSRGKPMLVVFEDLGVDCYNSKKIESLFVRESHHNQITAILVCQNLYQKGSVSRNIFLNCSYQVVLRSPKLKSQLVTLGTQLFPGQSHVILQSFTDCTKNSKYGYLVIDANPQLLDENYRLKTNIFPGEDLIIYKVND